MSRKPFACHPERSEGSAFWPTRCKLWVGELLQPKPYYVYILSNRSRTLYTGVTNSLVRRVREHREGLIPGFTSRYRVHRLVYFERYQNVRRAIAREKQIKGWLRAKKVALIEERNPTWDDLAAEWFQQADAKGKTRADPFGKLRAGSSRSLP